MALVLGVSYLVLAALTASLVTRLAGHRVAASEPGQEGSFSNWLWPSSVWMICFGSLFFLPFYAIGLTGLWIGYPRIGLWSLAVAQLLLLSAGLTAAVAIIGWPVRYSVQPRRWRPAIPRLRAIRWPVAVLVMVAFPAFLLIGAMLAVGYPGGFEPMAYHLPIGVHVFQSGTLETWDNASMHTFPANMSLYAGFLLQILPERLVSAANFPYLGVACLVTYGLGRITHGDHSSSLLAAVGLATVPMVAFSSFELGADVAGIAFLGLAFLACLVAPAKSLLGPIFAGLAAGLAFGFKSLHLIGAAFLFLVVVVRAWQEADGPPSSHSFRKPTAAGVAFLAGAALTAGVWLVRNYVEFGNPLYPVHLGAPFDLLGWSKAPDVDYLKRSANQFEWVRSSAEWLIYPWMEWHYIDQNFKHSSGLGSFFAAGVPVALGVALYDVTRRSFNSHLQPGSSQFNVSALALGALFIVVVWWFLDDRQPRYVMGALVLAIPLVARLITRQTGRLRRVLELVLGFSVLAMLFVISSKQIIEFGSRFVVSKQYSRSAFYEYPKAIDHLPKGSIIGNLAGRPRNYHVFGETLENKVISQSRYLLKPGSFPQVNSGEEAGPRIVSSQGEPGGSEFVLSDELVRDLGLTHLYVLGAPPSILGGCTKLIEIDHLDRNLSNNARLPERRTVFALISQRPGSRATRTHKCR